MIPVSGSRLYLAILLSAAAVVALPADDLYDTFSIVPPPAWVSETTVPDRPSSAATDGEAYLLLDYQRNVASEEAYTRIVKELLSPGGVAQGSTVQAWYDPSYQRLMFHHIRVIRYGVASSRLSRQAVHLLRRELSLESQMLDGSLTASVVLEDVRPGDRLDFAFTVRGRNPALAGRFVDAFTCAWNVPVARQRVRILSPAGRPLTYKMHGAAAGPALRPDAGVTEYVWEFADTPPLLYEDLTPSWHISAPWLQVSEYKDWDEVRRWAAALYPPAELPAELERLVASWQTRAAAPLDKALAALDWIQQNIRYVGIELGIGSFVPSPPATVCERRFGDCKDQSYLLCALLRRLGLQAEPVLVNTWARHLVADMLPSPFAFNHVVTRIRSGTQTYLVDPTDSFQRGAISGRYMPDYGHGLVLADGAAGLLAFRSHQGTAPEMEIVMRVLAADWEQPAILEVESELRGGAADNLRGLASTTRKEELAKSYLNYYAARYPGIQPAGDLRLQDDPGKNVFHTTERYSLPEFWIARSAPKGYRAKVFADAVIDAIPNPDSKVRATPLAVEFPHRILQRIELQLPQSWEGKSETLKFSNAAFELAIRRVYGDRTLTLTYDYRTRAASVPAKDFAKYQRSVMEIEEELGYEIWTEEGGTAAHPKLPATLPLAVGFFSLALLAAGAVWANRRFASASVPALAPETAAVIGQSQGLGGWLVPVAIGLFARPIFSIASLIRLAPLLTSSAWREFTHPSGSRYHALWGAFILFDLVSNIALAVAAVLLLSWFFQRRRVFPPGFICLLVGQALIFVADFGFGRAVVGADAPDASLQQVLITAVSSGLWIAYMLRSTRVRLTFVR